MSIQDELLRIIQDARVRGFHIDDELLRREVLALVDERQRKAMVFYWLQGLKQAEVARTMGITQKNVSKLLSKGAQNLAARLALIATAPNIIK